jgi:predicted permease
MLERTIWSVTRQARSLLREPAFLCTTVLLLGLGLGGALALGILLHQTLVRPLPYANADRLVTVRELLPGLSKTYPSLPANARHVLQWQQQARSIDAWCFFLPGSVSLSRDVNPHAVGSLRVSAGCLAMLRASLTAGQGFASDENARPPDGVVIVTDAFWRRELGGDPHSIGRTIVIDEEPHTVAGILRPGFYFPKNDELGPPLTLPASVDIIRPVRIDERDIGIVGDFEYGVIGRLSPGATPSGAERDLNAILSTIVRDNNLPIELRALVEPLRDSLFSRIAPALWLLTMVVAAALVLVCANVSALVVARATVKAGNFAIKRAIGANTGDLCVEVAGEALVIMLISAGLSLAIASALLRLATTAPFDVPMIERVHIEPASVLGALLLCAAATLLCVVAPWSPALRISAARALGTIRSVGAQGPARRWRGMLVATQVAVSVVLLANAGALRNTVSRLLQVDRGFATHNVATATLTLPPGRYGTAALRRGYFRRVTESLASIPGVTRVGFVDVPPIAGSISSDVISYPEDVRPISQRPIAKLLSVDAGYFSALSLRSVRGRLFESRDVGQSTCIVSSRTAMLVWGTIDVVGRKIRRGDSDRPPLVIIGVVTDVRYSGLTRPADAALYTLFDDQPSRSATLLLRANDERSSGMAAHALSEVRRLDPEVRSTVVQSLDEVAESSIADQRFSVLITSIVGVSALALAAVGIYGIVACLVSQNTREFALRKALGASRGSLYRIVMKHTTVPVVLGSAVGCILIPVSQRALGSLIVILASERVAVTLVACLVVSIAAAIGAYLPCRSIVNAEPAVGLRAN